VLGFRPVTILLKLPVPVPSEVFESAVVGSGLILQQIPLAVTSAEPSEVTLPPDCTEYWVMTLVAEVVNTGAEVTGGSLTVPDFVQETNTKIRKAGNNIISLKEIKDTPWTGVVFFMLVDLKIKLVWVVYFQIYYY
jgi:hypothetical protein